MLAGATDRQIEQEITNLPEYGQDPPAAPDGTGQWLPEYHQQSASTSSQQQAVVAAKDTVFSRLGS